jgi:hypothetical protein
MDCSYRLIWRGMARHRAIAMADCLALARPPMQPRPSGCLCNSAQGYATKKALNCSVVPESHRPTALDADVVSVRRCKRKVQWSAIAAEGT